MLEIWPVPHHTSAASNCKLSGMCFSSGVYVAQEFTQREIIVTGSQVKYINYDSELPLGSCRFLNNECSPNTSFPKFVNETHTLRGRKKLEREKDKKPIRLICMNTEFLKIVFLLFLTTFDWTFSQFLGYVFFRSFQMKKFPIKVSTLITITLSKFEH